ncbi:ABC transporter, permease protein [Alteracholeplasma palmae J233]|uniref:ABC transporter, permease protein n=1 Tax=Alteracholeplasma palmae (strain ATCC 49389 / J233) TaxID=1318466 RepID=U4KPD4_ALTPJ|nr:ABC transporter permease subunit [Alteracholeplasma palmae]CCV64090.1 ABC transporter, permease protein [Alteracholeplasma palmae J233]
MDIRKSNESVNLQITQKELEELRRVEIEEYMQKTKLKRYAGILKQNWQVYAMLVPVLLFFILFRYKPVGEMIAAFTEYDPKLSAYDSQFYGFYALRNIMFGTEAVKFWRAFRNTFTLSMYGLLFGFPIPIFLALMFSEIKNSGYRAVTQILTYLPKFISTVVITSLLSLMLMGGNGGNIGPGVLNRLLQALGVIGQQVQVLDSPKYFRSVYILSDIWEGAGYGSIVYFAAIMAISPTNYEAAKIDGANKLAQIRYVTLPGMAPTLTVMLILRIGSVLSLGYEKVMLMTQNRGEAVLETAEVISTYVLGMGGLLTSSPNSGTSSTAQALATSADLFNSLIAMFLVLGANFISRRVSDTSLF